MLGDSPNVTALAMVELGNQLARRRTRLQKTIEICAADLGFRCRYLKAIETGQINQIPWPSLTREIVREYATYLGLSGEKIALYYFASEVKQGVLLRDSAERHFG